MDSKISVIMAAYNCAGTIEQAIDSILAQTYQNWVMIICDDGSTDETPEILARYRQNHPHRFVLLRNDTNRKLPYSLNRCLSRVHTELVARMDADDWSHPERFQKQVDYLLSHPQCHLLGTGMLVSDGQQTLTEILQPSDPNPEDLIRGNCFSHATIMTYKRVYDALGGYSLDPSVERCEDLDLWFRFFAAGFRGHNLPDCLYRILEDDRAVRRRTLQNRIHVARTLVSGYRLLGLHGPACWWRPCSQILLFFLPREIYKKLHIRNITRQSRKYLQKHDYEENTVSHP